MNNETAAAPVRARVLRAGILAGRDVKPDDVVEVPEAEAGSLVADGAIDVSPAAVAYAESLLPPPPAAEPVIEAADPQQAA